jgi:putative FmdB family regulatory protein
MPQYEFICHGCKQAFSKSLTLSENEGSGTVCSRCGSDDVEQCWTGSFTVTSKKSA